MRVAPLSGSVSPMTGEGRDDLEWDRRDDEIVLILRYTRYGAYEDRDGWPRERWRNTIREICHGDVSEMDGVQD